MKYVMIIDLRQCVGCDTCTVACKLDNGTGSGIRWGRVVEEEAGSFPEVKKIYVPLLCMHCEQPECLRVCPTGATYKDERGIVLIDYAKCMGCRYCMLACPYEARHYNESAKPPEGVPDTLTDKSRAGAVEKCDLCEDRLSQGSLPRCVELCPYGARVFGDADDPNSEVAKLLREDNPVRLKADEGFGPSVYYLGVERESEQ
jgi:molybdopterin-containing oxidoreductase family iron-sulfur binding subunit